MKLTLILKKIIEVCGSPKSTYSTMEERLETSDHRGECG
jgi:hypothetical protein